MRKPIDGFAATVMIVLCLAWGLQQVAIKAVIADVSPMLQVAVRCGIAALLVWVFSRLVARERWLPGIALRSGLVAGILFALEFLFIAEGLRRTNASHMAVLIYTAPMFAAVGLHLRIPDERLTPLQWIGIGLAFAGLAVAFLAPVFGGGDANPASRDWLLGDFIGLCAGASWGLTTVVIRTSRLSEAPAAQTLFYQLAVGFVLLLPFALAIGDTHFHSTALVWGSLAFQSVVISFLSYLTWFWLLRKYFAAKLGVLSFLTPLFGVALGIMLLHERVSIAFIVGSVFVLIGLIVVNGQGWLRQVLMRDARRVT
ncbi:MAG TPA: DMT family transporter [Paraburkholderia sp.]